MIRDRVAARVRDMLEHLRLQVAMLPDTELDVLRVLERPQQFELAVDVSNFLMERLGAKPTAAKERRFDKTHRALAKQSPKPPRGLTTNLPRRKRKPTPAAATVTPLPEVPTDG